MLFLDIGSDGTFSGNGVPGGNNSILFYISGYKIAQTDRQFAHLISTNIFVTENITNLLIELQPYPFVK